MKRLAGLTLALALALALILPVGAQAHIDDRSIVGSALIVEGPYSGWTITVSLAMSYGVLLVHNPGSATTHVGQIGCFSVQQTPSLGHRVRLAAVSRATYRPFYIHLETHTGTSTEIAVAYDSEGPDACGTGSAPLEDATGAFVAV